MRKILINILLADLPSYIMHDDAKFIPEIKQKY